MKKLLILLAGIVLSGCQTVTTMQGMRDLPEAQRVRLEVAVPWRDAYQALLERVRMCQAFSAGRATLMANGDLREDIGTISLVSYIGTVDPHYLILVDVRPGGAGASITATASSGPLGNYSERLKYWAGGGQECAPPKSLTGL
jgi:hypothetical protein